ncbi:hypothetical protein [Tardiphaga sp. P9-11]|uniref:hypothetical protein n=1 Tax=Tardiphaga sp. P9-11 TaxID=2024614 RepID=UPI0011F3AF26|nr:hypothetical protein [Tardiphaga sp. P9-11]KAA0070016.1 hypothetical protein CIW50_28040 [Tardiphaga sp. P9-11]
MTTKQDKRTPTHYVYAVEDVTADEQANGKKAFWTKIGAAWPNADGKGFSVRFTCMPINGRITMREVTADEGVGQ